MATSTQRIAALEAEVARWRDLVEPTIAMTELIWKAGYATGQASTVGATYRAAAAASQPRPRHLHAVPGGAR
jgi:hypothetical protein